MLKYSLALLVLIGCARHSGPTATDPTPTETTAAPCELDGEWTIRLSPKQGTLYERVVADVGLDEDKTFRLKGGLYGATNMTYSNEKTIHVELSKGADRCLAPGVCCGYLSLSITEGHSSFTFAAAFRYEARVGHFRVDGVMSYGYDGETSATREQIPDQPSTAYVQR